MAQNEGLHNGICTKMLNLCKSKKRKNIKEQGKLQPLLNPMMPWHWMESDLVGPLLKSKGKDTIYVVINQFTKYAYFVQWNCKMTEPSIVEAEVSKVVLQGHAIRDDDGC